MKNASIQDKPTAHLNSFSQELDNSVTDERDNFHDIQIQVMSTEHDEEDINTSISMTSSESVMIPTPTI